MKLMKLSRLFVFLLLMAVAVAIPQAVAHAQDAADVNITFQKASSGEGRWAGTVDGDVQGALETVALNIDNSNPVWAVEFDWIIDAGEQSFTARMTGTLDSTTGAVVMDGEVVDGWMKGARAHEEGQMVDPDTLAFEGVIQLFAEEMAPETLPVTGGAFSGQSVGTILSLIVLFIAALL